MKKIQKLVIGASALLLVSLFSCEQTGSGSNYEAINRQKAIFLVDKNSGEVFMMNLVVEKGQGVVGSDWKSLGSPANAK